MASIEIERVREGGVLPMEIALARLRVSDHSVPTTCTPTACTCPSLSMTQRTNRKRFQEMRQRLVQQHPRSRPMLQRQQAVLSVADLDMPELETRPPARDRSSHALARPLSFLSRRIGLVPVPERDDQDDSPHDDDDAASNHTKTTTRLHRRFQWPY